MDEAQKEITGERGSIVTEPQTVPVAPERKVPGIFKNLLGWVVVVGTFFLAVFTIPNPAVAQDASKMWVLVTMILIGFILAVVHLLMRGSLKLPKGAPAFAFAGVLVATLLSTLASGSRVASTIGLGFQYETLLGITLLTLLAALGFIVFRDRAKVVRFILVLFASFLVVALFQVIRAIFGADALSFGAFTNPAFSLVGKWNDLAVFSALILLLSVVTEHSLKDKGTVRGFAIASAIIATLFLVAVNFWILWLLLAIIVAIFALRTMFVPREDGKFSFSFKNASYPALVVVILGICFGFLFRFPTSDPVSQKIVNFISPQPNYREIVLLPSHTLSITGKSWSDGAPLAIFGTGPNRFSTAFFKHKPDGVNNSEFWDSSFDAGFSQYLTTFTTVGFLGGLAWTLLYLVVLFSVYRALSSRETGAAAFVNTSVALGSLLLFGVMAIYLPNLTNVALAFLFASALFASRSITDGTRTKDVSLPSAKGWGVAMVPIVVLFAILVVVMSFEIVQSLRADAISQEARSMVNQVQPDLKKAATLNDTAIALAPRDTYYRLATDLTLLELQRILSEAPTSPDQLRQQVLLLSQAASSTATKALAADPTNYLNYINNANIWDLFATLGIDRVNTGPLALKFYQDAAAVNPMSPRLPFASARMKLLLGDKQGAIQDLERSRSLRPAYPEVLAALAELYRQDGNVGKAISATSEALRFDPSNFVVFFQLGFLLFTNQDYANAIAALQSAVAINPYYADAHYFLGVSLARLKDPQAAMREFRIVEQLNPGNSEIARVIKNLTEGRDPLQDAGK